MSDHLSLTLPAGAEFGFSDMSNVPHSFVFVGGKGELKLVVSVEETEYVPGKKSLWATFYHSIRSPIKQDGKSMIRMPENAYDLVKEVTEEEFLECFLEDEKEVLT